MWDGWDSWTNWCFFGQRYWAYWALAEKKNWDILFCPIGPKKNFGPITLQAVEIIGGLKAAESQTLKGTQYTGGWNFFVPDFNKLPYSLCSQGDNWPKHTKIVRFCWCWCDNKWILFFFHACLIVPDCPAPVIGDEIGNYFADVNSEKIKLQTVLFICLDFKNWEFFWYKYNINKNWRSGHLENLSDHLEET